MTVAASFADHAVLRRAVGVATLARGQQYADDGAVIGVHWDDDGERVVGQVRGRGQKPYTAIAIVDSAPDGGLRSFRGACTCPVGTNCKHAVALALARPSRHDTPDWERQLRALTDVPRQLHAGEEPSVALQLELTAPRAHDPLPHLNLRPVLAGSNGKWVRTGISWSRLHAHRGGGYGHRLLPERQLALLSEIKALDAAPYYPRAGSAIDLTQFPSRRIWDLLTDAADSGIPLVPAGAKSSPVRLHREPVEVVLDFDRDADGLALRPTLIAADASWPGQGCLALGARAHGLAWRCPDGLHLARLATDLDESMRELLRGEGVRVPAADEHRFFGSYYPKLRHRVRTTSSTGSVELPHLQPPTLLLTVHHDRADEVRFAWSWLYRVGAASRTEPLWPDPLDDADRDITAEGAVHRAVADVLAEFPSAFEPAGHRLSAASVARGMDAVHFVSTLVPALERLEGVEVETRGTPAEYQPVEGATEIAFTDTTTDGDWFDLAVTVSIGGHELPFEPLFVALATGQPTLVLPDGRYLDLDRPELRELAAIIADARALQDAPPRAVRVNRYHAETWEQLGDLGTISGPASQWQQTVRGLTDLNRLDDVAVPPTLHATLRPYQEDGLRWLAFLHAHGLGGILADDMGLGKTIQALALVCHARADRPFLIVAPTSVMSNWVSESARFAPSLRVRSVTETAVRRGADLADIAGDADVVVTSYTLFRLEFAAYAALDWAGLVLDEAQAAKNHLSRNYECAKQLPAPFKLAITGTPMENHLGELWSLLSITAPGLFATITRFDQHYRRPIERGRDRDRLALLRSRIRPVMLRRTKDEVAADLPEKQEHVLEVELHPRHRRAYQTLLQRERQKVLGLLDDLDGNRFEILRSLTLLRQASLDIGLVDPSAGAIPSTKLDVLVDLLDGIAADGHRTLVFSQFTRFLQAARDRLDAAGVAYCYLDGSTRKRADVLADFKTGDAPVFLISLKAGGVGLNLAEADYCVLLDPWWNPATEAQAVDRAHRIGQRNKVIVYRMVAKETIEEKVAALKQRKAELFANVLGTGDFASSRLTAADIRAMLD